MVQTNTTMPANAANAENYGVPTQEQIMAMNQMQAPRKKDEPGVFFGVAVPALAGAGAAYGAQRVLSGRALDKTALPNMGEKGSALERVEVLRNRDPKTLEWMVEQEVAFKREEFLAKQKATVEGKFRPDDVKAWEKDADKEMSKWRSAAELRVEQGIRGVGEDLDNLMKEKFEAHSFTPQIGTAVNDAEQFKTIAQELEAQFKLPKTQNINPEDTLEARLQKASENYHATDAKFKSDMAGMDGYADRLRKQGNRAEELNHVNDRIQKLETLARENLEAQKLAAKELAAQLVLEHRVGNQAIGSASRLDMVRHPISSMRNKGEMRGAALEEYANITTQRAGELEGQAQKAAERLGAGRVTALVVAGVGGTMLASKVVHGIMGNRRPANDVRFAQDMGRLQAGPQMGMGVGTYG